MTLKAEFSTGLLLLLGMIAFAVPAWTADSNPGGKPSDTKTSQQQRSDKTQQGEELVNKQPMAPQDSESQTGKQPLNTGADLTGGRDSHLGPHDVQQGRSQKK